MKKLLSLALALLIVASLVGCGSNQFTGGISSTNSTPQSSSASAVSSIEDDVQSVVSNQPTFPVSKAEFSDAMRASFEGFPDEPEYSGIVDNMDGSKSVQYSFLVDDCISIQCYETENAELSTVMLLANVDDISNTDLASDFGALEAILVGLFESDKETLAQVDKDLAIADSDLKEKTMTFAHGSIADYTYLVNDGIVSLMISPKAS